MKLINVVQKISVAFLLVGMHTIRNLLFHWNVRSFSSLIWIAIIRSPFPSAARINQWICVSRIVLREQRVILRNKSYWTYSWNERNSKRKLSLYRYLSQSFLQLKVYGSGVIWTYSLWKEIGSFVFGMLIVFRVKARLPSFIGIKISGSF